MRCQRLDGEPSDPSPLSRRGARAPAAGRIDPNPHQIDAVIFALQRIPQGGCILADEVDACDHPGLLEHRGARGYLALLQIAYEGFEPFESLCPVALLESGELLSIDAAEHLLGHAGLSDRPAIDPPLSLEAVDLDDAIEERRFLDRAAVEPHERGRLEEALDRIERHMEDRVMIWEQRRGELQGRLDAALRRRDAAVGAAARDRAETELAGLELEQEAVAAEIARLCAREDEDYETWRLGALKRRYNVPCRRWLESA